MNQVISAHTVMRTLLANSDDNSTESELCESALNNIKLKRFEVVTIPA